jgi:hypothetical protein
VKIYHLSPCADALVLRESRIKRNETERERQCSQSPFPPHIFCTIFMPHRNPEELQLGHENLNVLENPWTRPFVQWRELSSFFLEWFLVIHHAAQELLKRL